MSQPVMNGAIGHELVQKIMNYQLAIAQGEIESAKSVLHEDVVYIVPGSNIFSGTYTNFK
jgi:ketosteroid isomerase-like protein